MKFVDEVSIVVRSGKGGAGAVSFLRVAKQARGGPDGGDGGKGGNLIFRATSKLNSLLNYRFKSKYAAGDGDHGDSRDMTGADGKNLILDVPVGTIVRDADGTVLLDLDEPGETIFLKGGRGGKGNAFFKNSINQAPEHAQPGEDGETKTVRLELKLLADVGVIGYPNAGKSTLISSISAAKPKIADYPFTTLSPNLGVVQYGDEQTYVVADIPGLVPGAHKGVGLGTQFLKHIERTNLFVHLIDASGSGGRDPLQDYHDILLELREYDKAKAEEENFRPLSARTQLVVLNKIDVLSREQREDLKERFRKDGVEVAEISAATRYGTRELVFAIGKKIYG